MDHTNGPVAELLCDLDIDCELCGETVHVPVHVCDERQVDAQHHTLTWTLDHEYLAHHFELHRP